ncbi:MAG: c-type cytochrome [Alphaproteobacteria bacterium]|nr:c-type cytochrome [Alphaproteobacteria bacterium]
MSRSLVALVLVACGGQTVPVADVTEHVAPVPQASEPADEPASANALPVRDPADIPAGPEGDAIRRGREIALDTHRLLPDNVGNGLNCTNCHLKAGTVAKAAPWAGVTDRYPKFRKRSGKIDDLPDRMNGCFERSMNGKALEKDSEPMQALVAYATWLSEGVADGKTLEGIGMPRIEAPAAPDIENGRAVFEQKCVACHQGDGQGVFGPDDQTMFPPLWGDRSFNVGAGMARLDTAAAFVKWNMPLNQGGTLTDQEAYDVAAYFSTRERPDFAKKHLDWPNGDKPRDARY